MKAHRKSAAKLLFICYLTAAVALAIPRVFGILYFQAEVPLVEFPVWLGHVVTSVAWAFSFIIAVKTLTDLSLRVSVALTLPTWGILFFAIDTYSPLQIIGIISAVFLIPLVVNKKRWMALAVGAGYTVLIYGYEVLFIIFARGYPVIVSCPVVATVQVIDYYLFLALIYANKELIARGYSELYLYFRRQPKHFPESRRDNYVAHLENR